MLMMLAITAVQAVGVFVVVRYLWRKLRQMVTGLSAKPEVTVMRPQATAVVAAQAETGNREQAKSARPAKFEDRDWSKYDEPAFLRVRKGGLSLAA